MKNGDFVSYEEGGMIGYATRSICHTEKREVSLRESGIEFNNLFLAS